jgi:hypothetical protein
MLDFDELAPDKSKEKNLKRSPSISLRAKDAFPLLQISASVGSSGLGTIQYTVSSSPKKFKHEREATRWHGP